jgi:hypothetical protein
MDKYKRLESQIIDELEKAALIHQTDPTNIEPHKAILFFLKKYNTGRYYGTIALKITGAQVQNPKELEVTHRLDLQFEGSKV